jgi:hypothetical protein
VASDRQRCVQSRQSVAVSHDANRVEIGVLSRNVSKRQFAGHNSLTEARCASKGAIARKLMEELEVIEKCPIEIFRYQNMRVVGVN